MNKLALLTVTLALSISAPAFAHDMAAMGDMDGDSAPNAMGGQMGMGAHMVMTDSRPQTPQDIERAHDVMNTLRRALVKYHDYHVALSEHYEIFLPTVPQDVYHFTDFAHRAAGVHRAFRSRASRLAALREEFERRLRPGRCDV